jgi:hypothetical protein
MAVFWVVAPCSLVDGWRMMMMEAARTSETLVNFYQTTRHYNPGDNHLRTHRRQNLKLYNVIMANLVLRSQIILLAIEGPRSHAIKMATYRPRSQTVIMVYIGLAPRPL